MKMIEGSVAKARAIATRCFMPLSARSGGGRGCNSRNARSGGGRISTHTLRRTRQVRAEGERGNADLIKAEQKTRLQLLTAPVDGVVQRLAIHTVGGVVTPAQSLLVVVPSGSRLEIEAMVSNRDIGFVQPEQEAEIKIDTFNFTRYGLLHGQVLSVSQDAIIRDRQQDRSNDRALGTQNDTSKPRARS